MDEKNKGASGRSGILSKLTSNLKIRSKLLWSFAILISLTLVVIVIALYSQTLAQRTIDDLVKVQGKIVRLSLETERAMRQMQGYEKDFLLYQEGMGIQEAKAAYLTKFNDKGGEAFQTLYQIQQLSESPKDDKAAQLAMDSITNYQGAFIGTVYIIEQRVDSEFGELVKLNESVDILGDTISGVTDSAVQNGFYLLKAALSEYLRLTSDESVALVTKAKNTFGGLTASQPITSANMVALQKQLKEFDKWFTEVTKTDAIIDTRIAAYQETVKRAEPVIRSFLANAATKEAVATVKMEDTAALVKKIVLVVGAISVLVGVFIAMRLAKGLTSQVNLIMELLGEIGMGNFSARTEVVSGDELGTMATTLNAMLDNITVLIQSQDERDSIQDSIMTLLDDISALTEGDFTGRAEVTEDMTGAIADSFNAMADQFTDIISKVKVASRSVGETSEDVASQTMTLANKNIEQVKGVTRAVSAIDNMVESIREVAANAQQSAGVSRQSRVNAQAGAEAVNQTTQAMTEIREQINETARSIKRLGESSMEIGNIVQIIDDIADRTSILALNASIQAAMAGDAGHGFAVVADEVQRLADSSSSSTKQIDLLVKSIRTEISDVSNRMDESISKVVQGSKLADGAHDKLQEIENVSNQLAELIEAITTATTDQVEASEIISKTMQEVGEISRESSISSQDTATSMNDLRGASTAEKTTMIMINRCHKNLRGVT